MKAENSLPTTKIKEFDTQKLEKLAKRVRRYFEEESKYLREQNQKYGTNKNTKLYFPS